MRRILLTALIQFIALGSLSAQFTAPDSRTVNMMKGRVLAVEMKDEVTRTLINLKPTPDEYKGYRDAIAARNDMLKRAVEKYWNFGRGAEFKSELEIRKILEEGDPRYVVLSYELRSGAYIDQLKYIDVYARGPYDSDVRRIAKEAGYGVFKLVMPSRQGAETVYTVQVPVAYPSEGDMIFAVQTIMNLFNNMQKIRDYELNDFEGDVARYNDSLKQRTLLIDKTQLARKTDIEDLKKGYPYPLDVVDYEMINAAIISQDASYAYVQILPYGLPDDKINATKIKMEVFQIVADAEGGQVMATSKPTRLDYDKVAEDISRKEVSDYIRK